MVTLSIGADLWLNQLAEWALIINNFLLPPVLFIEYTLNTPYSERVIYSSLYCVHISTFSLEQRLIAPVKLSRGSSSFYNYRPRGWLFHHKWDVCQKSAIATLCVLCVAHRLPVHISKPSNWFGISLRLNQLSCPKSTYASQKLFEIYSLLVASNPFGDMKFCCACVVVLPL